MSWKGSVGAYFRFTRKERVAVLALSGLILLVFFLPSFFPSTPSREKADGPWADSLQALTARNSGSRQQEQERSFQEMAFDREEKQGPAELFYFDPNSLGPEGWKKLGIRDRTVQTIQRYLARGGRFRTPEDLGRIYGLSPEQYQRLLPYVRIATLPPGPEGPPTPHVAAGKPPQRNAHTVDINLADTTAFIDLPGIGGKLASRIVNFREKLGGFYSVDQLAETFGLPDSTFQRIKPLLKLETGVFRRIDLNKATLDELRSHPYIRWNLARPIIAYREQHGPFAKTEDLKLVMAVTEDLYRKIAPYLSVSGQ